MSQRWEAGAGPLVGEHFSEREPSGFLELDRAPWSVLDADDFAAVDDLPVYLVERHGHGDPIDVVGSVDVGHYLVDVLAWRAVVVMLTRMPADVIVLAIGRT